MVRKIKINNNMNSPFKQTNNPFNVIEKKKRTRKQRKEDKKIQEEFHNLEVKFPPVIPVPEPPIVLTDTTKTK